MDLRGNLATVAQYLPPETNIAADGAVALTGSLRGTLKRIEPDLMLTVDNGLILSPTLEPGFSNIVLRARVENGEADIEQLTANWGTASLQASGQIPLEVLPQLPVEIPRMSGPATFKAAFLGLDPSAIPGAPPQLSGRISAEAEVTAASADAGGDQRADHVPGTRRRVQRARSRATAGLDDHDRIGRRARSSNSICPVQRARFTPAGASDSSAIAR